MGLLATLEIKTVTCDDFYTLRYPVRKKKEDIIFPILKALKGLGIKVDDEEFLKHYFIADKLYRKRLKETLRESLLDDIVMGVLVEGGYKPKTIGEIVKEAVDYGIATRKAKWFPDAKTTLMTLRERGYKLGLISNTHWRIPESLRKEFKSFFDVITLSYEHGYAKPHPSVFVDTLKKLRANANHSLHVGDDPISDVQGAKNVGMKTTFIKRREIKTNADIEIERLIELTKFL